MKPEEWRAIEAAAAELGLNGAASAQEIREAYHQLSRQFHPDVVGAATGPRMARISAAYTLLKNHCETWRIPLKAPTHANPEELYDPEDWWQARFGANFWGGKR